MVLRQYGEDDDDRKPKRVGGINPALRGAGNILGQAARNPFKPGGLTSPHGQQQLAARGAYRAAQEVPRIGRAFVSGVGSMLTRRPGLEKQTPEGSGVSRGISPYLQKTVNSAPIEDELMPEPQAAFGKSVQDYIKMFQGQDGGVRAAFDAQRQQAQNDFARGNTDLGAMYSALANSIRQSNQENAARQQQFQQMSQQATQANSGVLNDAFTDARGATQSEADALGIGDFKSQAAKTGQEYNDLGQAANAAYGQTAQQALLGNAQAADQQGTANVSAAQFGGVQAQAALAANLQKYLTQLGSEEAMASQAAQDRAAQLGMSAYDRDSAAYNDYRNYLTERDDQGWNRGMQQAELYASQQGGAEAPDYSDGTVGAFQYLSAQGLPPAARDAIWGVTMNGLNNMNPGQTNLSSMYKRIDDSIARGEIPPEYADKAYSLAALLSQTKFN